MAQITALRLINVAIFVAALLLFRQLLLRVRVSSVLTNITLLFFVLIPVVPYLAAQINYDNLIMLAAAGALLLALSINEKLDRRKLPVGLILWLLTLCLFASLVQFIFLPIFAAIVLWFGWRIWRGSFSPLKGLRTAWRVNSWRGRLLVGLPLLIAIGLFTHMYGYNLVAYRTPIPQCNEVLSERQCAEHGPWVRNHQALLTKTEVNPNPALYAGGWLYRMFVSLFYTSSGGASPQAWYLSVNPLPVAFGIALLVFGAGLVFVARYGRHVLSDHRQLGFLLFVGLVYITALWLRNYHSYLHFGQKLAINGRYLLPVILPLMALMALSYRQALAGFPRLRIVIAGAVLLLVMQGGGIINYLVVSNKYWYWPNRAVIKVNQAAQRVVKPLVIIEMPLKSVDQYL